MKLAADERSCLTPSSAVNGSPATFRKDRRLNIRLSSKDLEAIQKLERSSVLRARTGALQPTPSVRRLSLQGLRLRPAPLGAMMKSLSVGPSELRRRSVASRLERKRWIHHEDFRRDADRPL